MRILVTGCAGFIGSNLTLSLLKQGHQVVGIDALTDYYQPSIKRRNLKVLDRPGFAFREADVSALNPDDVNGIDLIFHLAAQPGVRASWGDEFSGYAQSNLVATERLLSLARRLPLTRFVYASSSSVYGNVAVERVHEDHALCPCSPYGVTKLAGELLCQAYCENYQVPVTALRFFTVYGPRQRPDMAFHRLIHAALTGEVFELYGDGNQERDFTYVGDVVQALEQAALGQYTGRVFNVGGGSVVSMVDVIALIERFTGKRIRIKRFDVAAGDVKRTSADISRARLQLGYSPAFTLQTALPVQIEFLDSILSGKVSALHASAA